MDRVGEVIGAAVKELGMLVGTALLIVLLLWTLVARLFWMFVMWVAPRVHRHITCLIILCGCALPIVALYLLGVGYLIGLWFFSIFVSVRWPLGEVGPETWLMGILWQSQLLSLCGCLRLYLPLRYAPPAMPQDRALMLRRVERNGLELQHLHGGLNHDVVMMAVRNDGNALQYAREVDQSDVGVVLAAYQQNRESLQYSSEHFQSMGD